MAPEHVQVLGLPVLLSPEELRLLHARGKITMLNEDVWARRQPSDAEVGKFRMQRGQ